MSKATESMFDGKDVLIPLAEVSYILKFPSCIEVHFKGSAESVTLVQPDQNALISAWCRYRSEVEADTLMDLDGAQPAPSVPEGWRLVPTAESRHPGIYKMLGALHAVDNTPGASEWESYAAFLAAAPEAKP